MENFYFFTVLISFLFIINKKIAYYAMVIGCVGFLLTFPTNELDYDTYKDAYDNSVLTSEFPWLYSETILTSERGYIYYQAFFGVFLPFGFPSFLAINFLICLAISFFIFKNFADINKFYSFWVFSLPVIFPTIFYFSPRSTISYFLVFFGISLFLNKKSFYFGLLMIYFGFSIHSQFILMSFFIVLTYFLLNNDLNSRNKNIKIICIISFCIFVLTFFMSMFSSYVSEILSFTTDSEYAQLKFSSFQENKSTGFRLTSILSVFIYPIMIFKLEKKYNMSTTLTLFFKNKKNDVFFLYLLFASIFYGCAINLGYYNTPHMAGRLARLSDYIGMGLIIPAYINSFYGKYTSYIILLLIVLLAPLIYSTLYYNVVWSF